VLGGGPVGIELAQMLRRFGAEVDLFEASDSLLEREDPRVGELVLAALSDDGIRVHVGTAIAAVTREGDYRVAHHADGQVKARQVIVAVGRKPRVAGLSLESVGIDPTPAGIAVDERCRAAEGVWAVGDVTGETLTARPSSGPGLSVRWSASGSTTPRLRSRPSFPCRCCATPWRGFRRTPRLT
jgi:dihydrolipoamide dehydrogenase